MDPSPVPRERVLLIPAPLLSPQQRAPRQAGHLGQCPTTTRSRPARFAAYSAASARPVRATTSSAPSQLATPIDAVDPAGVAVRSPSPTAPAVSASPSVISTPNSSPP